MTATIAQPTGAPSASPGGHAINERSLRIPDISADLLPVEITAARRTRTVRRTVVASLTAFAVVLAGWYGMAFQETRTASDELDNAQDSVQVLTSKQHGFTELVKVQKDAKTLNDQLSSLMAKDLQWSRLLQTLQSAAPAGITITGVTAALTTDQTAGAPNAKSGVESSDAIGTLTLGGVGTSKNVIAAFVDALAKVKGVANALPGDVTQQSSGLQFSVHMDITKAALGGRFTKTTGTGTK
jgi:Tfp pilus assembly protein PilN